MFHENFFDLESFLNDLYDKPDPKTVNINHVFQVKNSWHTLVIVKFSMTRQGLNRVVIRLRSTAVHRVIEQLVKFPST